MAFFYVEDSSIVKLKLNVAVKLTVVPMIYMWPFTGKRTLTTFS